jgi:hypothetical protein
MTVIQNARTSGGGYVSRRPHPGLHRRPRRNLESRKSLHLARRHPRQPLRPAPHRPHDLQKTPRRLRPHVPPSRPPQRPLPLLPPLLLLAAFQVSAQTPLPHAHAHNDYEHTRPLAEALEQGFGSVEADVYPVDGDLLVAHNLQDTKPERNLEKLYLAPIKERFDRNKGEIIPGLKTLILLVDIKTEGLKTYQILEKQIEKYKPMLTEFDGDQIKTNAVTIILSGDRPTEYLAKQTKRWAAIDGRMSDLPNNPPHALIPLVSDSWGPLFKWRTGEMSEAESAKLHAFVKQAHEQGRIIRFWGAPDREETWRVQNAAGVDLINTDHLAELAKFMKSNSN